MKPNDYFQKIFCINLDRRPDRWTRCVDIFTKFGLDVERVSATDGKTIEMPAGCKLGKGEIGCIHSHLGILRRMSAEGLNRVLILEDDVEFNDDWLVQLDIATGNLPAWDMFYLGCNHVTPPIPFQANVVRVTKGYTTSSYAITKKFAELVIPELEKLDRQVDVVYALKHRANPCYAIKPSVSNQRADHSDIQDTHTDYRDLFK